MGIYFASCRNLSEPKVWSERKILQGAGAERTLNTALRSRSLKIRPSIFIWAWNPNFALDRRYPVYCAPPSRRLVDTSPGAVYSLVSGAEGRPSRPRHIVRGALPASFSSRRQRLPDVSDEARWIMYSAYRWHPSSAPVTVILWLRIHSCESMCRRCKIFSYDSRTPVYATDST